MPNITYAGNHKGWNIYLFGDLLNNGYYLVQEEGDYDFDQTPLPNREQAKLRIEELIAECPEVPISEEEIREIVKKVIANPRTVQQLSRACQIFTSGLGEGGYYPNLGEPRTKEALKLMEEAGVKPVFHWEANHSKEDPFTKVES
jgi:hypothetical protein